MDTGLADRIRAKGVEVVEVAGWKTRGYRGLSFEAVLALMHHTAGGRSGAVPSLATCIYGRPDVPGPLIPVLQSREPDGWDKAYVIAAGKSNHGGTGVWRGVSGNGRAGGVEVEHTGTGTVTARRREVTCRILAALLEGPGGSRDHRNACQHFEYATPRGRKIDFRDLSPDTPDTVRHRVAYWIGRTAAGATPSPVPEEDHHMYVADCAGKPALLVGPDGTQKIDAAKRTALLHLGVPAKAVSSADHAALVDLGDARKELLNAAVDSVINLHAAREDSGLRQAVRAELEAL